MAARERVVRMLEHVDGVVRATSGRTRLLESIAWPREIEEAFFASGASAMPDVTYAVDRERANDRIAQLAEAERSIDGTDAIAEWLRSLLRSNIDGRRLMLAVGTREFHRLSTELYGSARTPFVGTDGLVNLDLAQHLHDRLTVIGHDEATDEIARPMTHDQLASRLRERLAARAPALPVEVVVDPNCTAKVVAGRSRVRIRQGATFAPIEADGLWVHEVETHALTAQNGGAQPHAGFMSSGGPRSTRTQEGLAIFAELYEHTLSIARMHRLVDRVKLVDMAERGADFVELYRFLVGEGALPRDAYFDAQRVCRGGLVTGGAPFTKDACYLGGLLDVYTYLAAMVRGGLRDEVELLACGRNCLDDMPALVELRHMGVLERPRYLPRWIENWDGLLPYFAFTSFLEDVDLSGVRKRHARVLELAAAQPPRNGGDSVERRRRASRGSGDDD